MVRLGLREAPEEEKARKVPQYTHGGRRYGKQGTPEDLAKLTTFALARDAAARRGLDGVGFALTQDCGIVALDFDNCVVDGKLHPTVEELVSCTYAEYSPSGKGVRAFFRGNLGNRKDLSTLEGFGFEVFSTSGFVTVTGNMLPFVDLLGHEDLIAKMTPAVEAYCQKRFGSSAPAQALAFDPLEHCAPKIGLSLEESYDLLQQIDPDIDRSDWIRVALALFHEYDGSEEAFELWDNWSSYGSKYPGDDRMRYEWESFNNRSGFRPTTMASVIKMAKEAQSDRPTEAASRDEVFAKAEAIMAELPQKSVGRFGPVPIYDLTLREPMEWLIKGVLPKGRLGVLFGASGSGKTFVALDLAFAIARGNAWRERRTTKGNVVVIAAEGGNGIGKRGDAYSKYHEFDLRDVGNLHVITAAPNFLDSDDISEVIAEIKNLGPIDAVIIDTLAQVSPGANENTSEDMGRVLANINLLHEACGAMNLVVHHAGKDLSKGSRGWSGLKAAADVQIEVLRHDDGAREIHIEKMKDGEDGLRWGFKLETVELGLDRDGDPITSCVAVPADLPKAEEKGERKGVKRRGRIENHVLEIMSSNFKGEDTLRMDTLIEFAAAELPEPEPGARDTRRQHVKRAIQNLNKEKDGPLRIEGNIVAFFE